MKNVLLLIGPSGSGKSTLENAIETKYPNFGRVISHTTREKREEEPDTAYHFVNKKEFQELDLAEWVQFAGNYYGITKNAIDMVIDKGLTPIIVVEPHGADQIDSVYNTSVVYIDISKDQMVERMLARGDSVSKASKRVDADNIEESFNDSKIKISSMEDGSLLVLPSSVDLSEAVDIVAVHALVIAKTGGDV